MRDLQYYIELNEAEETLKRDLALEEAREYVREFKVQILKAIALAVGKPSFVVRIPDKFMIHCNSSTDVSQYLIDAILEMPELGGYDLQLEDAENACYRKIGVTIAEHKEANDVCEPVNLPVINADNEAKYVMGAIVCGLILLSFAYLLSCAGYI